MSLLAEGAHVIQLFETQTSEYVSGTGRKTLSGKGKLERYIMACTITTQAARSKP